MGPLATLHQSSPSERSSHGLSPDQDTASLQSQLQHMAVNDPAMLTLPVDTVLDEQVSASAAVVGGLHAGETAAVDASHGADARFLDQLFCCLITKVLPLGPQAPVVACDTHLPHQDVWVFSCGTSYVKTAKLVSCFLMYGMHTYTN